MLGVMDLTVSVRFGAAAYCGWLASTTLGWYPAIDPLVMVASVGGAALVSALIWQLLKPLARHNTVTCLIGSLGLVQVFQAAFQAAFGAAPRVYSSYPVESGVDLAITTATPLQICGLAYAVLAVSATACLLRFGGWGRQLQLVAADPDLAETSYGVSRRKIEWSVNLIIAALIAPAAIIYVAGHGVSPTTGTELSLMAFVAAIVAGRQRPIGAVFLVVLLVVLRSVAIRWPIPEFAFATCAGFVTLVSIRRIRADATVRLMLSCVAGIVCFGLVTLFREHADIQLTDATVPSQFQELIPYLAIVVALLIRPTGILASRPERKV